jgi:hypothetical protein
MKKAPITPALMKKSWRRTSRGWWRRRWHLQPRRAMLDAVDDMLQSAPGNTLEEEAPLPVPGVPPAN